MNRVHDKVFHLCVFSHAVQLSRVALVIPDPKVVIPDRRTVTLDPMYLVRTPVRTSLNESLWKAALLT